MFLTDEDFSVVIGDDAIKVISRASQSTRDKAVIMAIEEVSSYLRPTYDTTSIFDDTGEKRNQLIVMFTADIALYHMVASLPQKMGIEIRKERYERAIKWLEGVQSGKITPDLPVPTNEDSYDNSAFSTIFHSEHKLRHNW